MVEIVPFKYQVALDKLAPELFFAGVMCFIEHCLTINFHRLLCPLNGRSTPVTFLYE
jgi:hypothetical protein